ncbi:RM38 protein, partial [Chordeiles acutipennis]|nr:RM38 protein [Chordeiles acutipennis]
MAAPLLSAALRGVRAFGTAAALCKRAAPLGPMPNEDIDVSKLEELEKYRSFSRYFKLAEKESRKPRWWKTYRQHSSPQPEPKTDIGLPRAELLQAKEIKERKKILRENHQNAEMERAARLRTVLIPLDEVRAEWEKTSGPFHKQRVAEHCGVFRDLFRGATFTPWVPLRVEYSQEDEDLVPVYYGNIVTPSEASSPPAVSYEADEGSLWTLLLTNPDGHLREADSEYLHWLVANIPGNDIKSGKEICHYLPPFPAMGTGYHRFVFLLFKQDSPIDFSEDVRPMPCTRAFSRVCLTSSGRVCVWEPLLAKGRAWGLDLSCLADVLYPPFTDMREPVFEFVRPPVYHPPQVKFPRHQPLRYLDRYRDTKEPTYGIY